MSLYLPINYGNLFYVNHNVYNVYTIVQRKKMFHDKQENKQKKKKILDYTIRFIKIGYNMENYRK